MVTRGDEKHFIIRFNNGGALRTNWASLTENRCHASIDVRHVIA
ncbi:Uncharacterised protein [Vibrio cholerae]|uniref:Uncharacterized protein n=1 Tax=Vibrio cholerae TaxID=666 RepID=A0A655WQU4_VIBCL|nr:Uncharacterised protein [Vibrio cholerae]CSB95935.1 Uncharacterised protein [Vibrio cholerae]CSC21171.1 Uncharacterised protein [Vibrio cholerae]CSC76558.1 Uncharacterised protein [Vibrio cholerae]CSC90875.1 Uncharacterised protein [Vibrio cholerae]